MNQQYEREMAAKYPILYSQIDKPITESCMGWGMECGDGWKDILDEASAKLEALNQEGVAVAVAAQVKEKYGTLRVYLHHYDKRSEAIVEELENKSEITCEVCGKPGRTEGRGWVSTRCQDCRGV